VRALGVVRRVDDELVAHLRVARWRGASGSVRLIHDGGNVTNRIHEGEESGDSTNIFVTDHCQRRNSRCTLRPGDSRFGPTKSPPPPVAL
jgi:hypothetical protein